MRGGHRTRALALALALAVAVALALTPTLTRCEEAIRAGVQGNRGELFAIEVAKASAALNGRDRVEPEDLQMGVRLCIAPRGTQISAPDNMDDMMAPPPPPPPPTMEEDEDEDMEKVSNYP